MKRAYTIFNSDLKRISKTTGVSVDTMIERHTEQVKIIGGDEYAVHYGMFIHRDIIEGRCVHVFMPDIVFCEWLIGCVPFLEFEHGAVIQKKIGNQNSLVLHFPTSSKLSSVGIWLPEKTFQENGVPGPDYGVAVIVFSSEHPAGVCMIRLDASSKPKDPAWDYYGKLFCGLAMYWSCFPETVKDGVPEDLKHTAYHNNPVNKTVSVSPEIFHGDHASPTAHFRKGHFRCLRSEKFKNKRFQVVFVHETFVNGKAKTVLAPEEV